MFYRPERSLWSWQSTDSRFEERQARQTSNNFHKDFLLLNRPISLSSPAHPLLTPIISSLCCMYVTSLFTTNSNPVIRSADLFGTPFAGLYPRKQSADRGRAA